MTSSHVKRMKKKAEPELAKQRKDSTKASATRPYYDDELRELS